MEKREKQVLRNEELPSGMCQNRPSKTIRRTWSHDGIKEDWKTPKSDETREEIRMTIMN
jgi:hypothetical protein